LASQVSVHVFQVMDRELGTVGKAIVKKQCNKLGIHPDEIEVTDLPKLSRAISEAMAWFGAFKAKDLHKELLAVGDVAGEVEKTQKTDDKLSMVQDLAKGAFLAGNLDDALNFYDQLQGLAEGMGRTDFSVEALRGKAGAHLRLGDYDAMKKELKKALDLANALEDKHGYRMCRVEFGAMFWKKGEYAKAIGHVESVLEDIRVTPDDEAAAMANKILGNIYDERGDQDKGIEFTKRSLMFYEKLGDMREAATGHNNLGVAYARKGDLDEAVKQYKKCIAIAKKESALRMEGWASFNAAECMAYLGQFSGAQELVKRSEDIFKRLDENLGLSGVYMAYAIIYREMKAWDQSSLYFEMTLRLRKMLGTPYRTADALYEFGKMLAMSGDKERAKERLEKAKDVFKSIDSRAMVRKCVQELAMMD